VGARGTSTCRRAAVGGWDARLPSNQARLGDMTAQSLQTIREQPGEYEVAEGEDRLLPSPRHVLLLYGIWLLPAVLMSAREALSDPVGQRFGSWVSDLVHSLWYWIIWASACPLMYRLIVRYPLRRRLGGRATAVHALAAAALTLFLLMLSVLKVEILRDPPESVLDVLIEELTSGAGRGRLLMNFSMYWMVLGALMLIRLNRLRKWSYRAAVAAGIRAARLESKLTTARLETLHHQINPHFLFNSLNSVGALIRSGESNRAFEMIGLLGGLLRKSVDSPREQLIPLHEEIDLMRRYLELERIRFPTRLEVEYEIEPRSRGVGVPALILQPLVENTIRHAVARRSEPTRVSVSSRCRDGRLHLSVTDDGPGLGDSHRINRGNGFGLRGTAERLELLYDGDAVFEVAQRHPQGVVCAIELPLDSREIAGHV